MAGVYQILLIEDDKSDAELIEIQLNKLDINLNIQTIRTKSALVEQLESNPPNPIISDYNLSDFTGIDALHIVREQYLSLPFILVSGYIGEEKAVDIMLAGASDYAMKDNLERLGAAVKRELQNYDQHLEAQQKIDEARKRQQSIINSVDGIVWEANAQTFEFQFVSSQVERLLGYTPEEWVNTPNFWQDHIHPEDRDQAVSYCHYKTKQRENHEFDYRMIDSKGEVVWMRDYVTVVNKENAPNILRGLMVDITNEKKAEWQRNKAYQIADIGHWELDPVDKSIFWSEMVQKHHEVEPGYQPGYEESLNYFKEGTHRENMTEALGKLLKTGEPFDIEAKIITAKGNERWLRVVGEAEMRNGTCVRVYGSAQNIHERKKTEQELEMREQRFRSLVQDGGDLIAILDKDGNYKYIAPTTVDDNQEAPSIDAIIGTNSFEYIHPNDKERVQQAFTDLAVGEQVEIDPFRYQTSNDHWVWKESTITNLLDNPAIEGYVINSRDVTERIERKNKLNESLRRYDVMSKATNDIIWDWDLNTDTVLWNDALHTILGYEQLETDDQWWYNHIHPDDREKLVQDIHQHIEQKNENWIAEYRFQCADGSYKAFLDRGFLLFDQNGEPKQMIGSMQDITERKEYEEELKQLSLVASKTTDLIVMTDANDKITWVNQAFEELTEYSFAEAMGKNPGDLLQGPETNPETVKRLAIAIQNQESTQEIIRNYTKSGDPYWLDLTIDPIFDKNGNCEGFIAVQKEVTEQIERQRALKESVDRYESVSKATSDTIWDLDLESDTIEYNQNIYNMFGYEKQQVEEIGDWWRNNIHPDDRAEVLETVNESLRSSSDRFQMEYRFQAAGGRYKYIYDRAFIVKDQGGEPIRVIGAMQDVTQQREEQKWLQLFESAVSTTTESVAIIEATPAGPNDGRKIMYVNEAFTKMTGYNQEEAIGQTLHLLNGPDTDSQKIQQIGQRMNNWETSESELLNYKKNGEPFWIHVSMAPVKNKDGSYSHWVCVGRDVSNRRQRERQLKDSLKEKETLLLEIHHRVKNNLAVVSGMMQLQAFEEDNDRLKEKLFASVARIQTMGSIHELLYQSESFSSLEFDKNIEKLVDNILDTMQTNSQIDVSFNIKPMSLNINQAIPCSLIVNEVITNILKHAFPEAKHGEIEVHAYEEKEEVFLTIKDNGKGLPKDFGNKKGDGKLGLQLIDTLATQLDAQYEYESDRDGAAFNLTFEKAEVKGVGNVFL